MRPLKRNYLLLIAGLLVLTAGLVYVVSGGATRAGNKLATPAFINSLGMEFVPVSGLTNVLFCRWETRVKDFRAFVEDRVNNRGYDYQSGMQPSVLRWDGWEQRGWEYGWYNPGFKQTDGHPVTCVSWYDAVAFCEWLTRVEQSSGKINSSQKYRLPTDSEWSVAVGLHEPAEGRPFDKNGKISEYPWRNGGKPPKRFGNYAGEELLKVDAPEDWNVMPGYNDGWPRTSPVGRYGAQHGQMCDMSGNVYEWCDDYYVDQGTGMRVMRGGSWLRCERQYLLSSSRYGNEPQYRSDDRGFRVVLSGTTSLLSNVATASAESRSVAKKISLEAILEAAEKGDAEAQFNLGVKYAAGKGMDKDEIMAARWFRKAAEQGHVRAQYNLGVMCANGQGGAKSPEEAKKWFQKAAEKGHEGAKAALKRPDVAKAAPVRHDGVKPDLARTAGPTRPQYSATATKKYWGEYFAALQIVLMINQEKQYLPPDSRKAQEANQALLDMAGRIEQMSLQGVDPELVSHVRTFTRMIRSMSNPSQNLSEIEKAALGFEILGFVSSMTTIQETLQKRYNITLPGGY